MLGRLLLKWSSKMILTQLNDVILLTVAGLLLVVIAVVQCASGKRSSNRKRNSSKTTSKATQSSVSSTQSTKKIRKSQREKVLDDARSSSQMLAQRKQQSKKEISSRSNSVRSSTSRLPEQSTTSKNKAAGDASRKELTVIPMVTAETPKDEKCDLKKKSKSDAVAAGSFVEQEQSTQEGCLPERKAEQEVIINPSNLRWSGEAAYQTVRLQNTTADRLAIKAKCSDNQLYRVNPVFAFIEPGESLKVDIIRQKGVPKVDKIIFVSVHAGQGDLFPKPLFKRLESSQKTAMLPLLMARG